MDYRSLLYNWPNRSDPLSWLPDYVRKQLRDAIDVEGPSGDTGFLTFATSFGYTVEQAIAIAARSLTPDFRYSKTEALLVELQQKGRSIQDVQRVLIRMRVAAADIIPRNMEAIVQHGQQLQQHQQQQQQQKQQQPYARNGLENSEESLCYCRKCQEQRYSRSQSFDPAVYRNGSVAKTFKRQTSVPQPGMNNLARQPQGHPHNQYPPSCNNVSEIHGGNRSRHSSMTNQQYNNDLETSTVNTLSGGPPTSSRTNPQYNNDLETSTVNNSSGYPPIHHSGDTGQPIQSSRSLDRSNDYRDNDQRSTTVRSQHQNNSVDNESARTNTERRRGDISSTSSASVSQSSMRNSQPPGDGSPIPYPCDDCRLQSDPHETQRLTLASVPKTRCIRCIQNSAVKNTGQVAPSTETCNPQDRSQQTARKSEQYASPSTANMQDNGDVNVHGGGGASSGRSDGARPKTSTSSKDNNRKKKLVCNATPRHVTGENRQSCHQCRQFLLDLQSRQHMSDGAGMTNSSVAGVEQRHSWPSDDNSASASSTSTPSLSDSMLNNPDSRDGNATHSWRETLSSHGNLTISSRNGDLETQQTTADNLSGEGNGRRKMVFFTYSWDGHDSDHLEEVISLRDRLKDEGIDVRFDMESSEFNRLLVNMIDWLDDMVENASYIIACISPAYYNDIQPTEHASPQINRLNARYVFDKLRNKYYRNGAQNHRVIPVIFENSGATMDHVHTSMSSTVVYTYPQQIRSVVDHILQPAGHGLLRVIQDNIRL